MSKLDKKLQFELYKDLSDGTVSISEASEKYNINRKTVASYKKKFDEGFVPEHPEAEDSSEFFSDNLEDFDTAKALDNSFKRAIRLLHKATEDAERGYVIVEDDTKRRVPIKTLMDCIEKAGKYATTMANAIDRKIMTESINYEEMARLYVKFNKQTGEFEYNEKEHMKEVLNTAYGKSNE